MEKRGGGGVGRETKTMGLGRATGGAIQGRGEKKSPREKVNKTRKRQIAQRGRINKKRGCKGNNLTCGG